MAKDSMELFGIGLPELFFIVIIALIVLGPKDMVKAGRTMGVWLRKIVMSPGWRTFQDTSREIRNLPNRLMREAGMEELKETTRQMNQQIRKTMEKDAFSLDPSGKPVEPDLGQPLNAEENRIAPPAPDSDSDSNKDAQTS
jgi:sec-independent protein translocase protein TatB